MGTRVVLGALDVGLYKGTNYPLIITSIGKAKERLNSLPCMDCSTTKDIRHNNILMIWHNDATLCMFHVYCLRVIGVLKHH